MSDILSVIVGGVIGVVGGIAGPPLVHWLNDKSDRRKKRAEKFEEMVNTLYEHDHWLNEARNILVFGSEGTEGMSPLPRAQAIVAVYFPTFNARLAELESAARNYRAWMLSAAQKRIRGNIDKLTNGAPEAYAPYWNKFMELVGELRAFAEREF